MKKSVNVESTFAWSVTIMVASSSLVLAAAEEIWWPTGITPLVALFTHFFVDRWKKIRLSVWAANTLGVIAFAAMSWEFTGGDVLSKLMSGAHLLVYMTWVVLLLRKGIRQYWWLAALSVLQVSVASVLTTSATFGMSLVFILLIMIWTMSVFTLYRARRRLARASDGVEDSLNADSLNPDNATDADEVLVVRNGLQLDPREPWIGWRFRSIVGFAFIASLVIAAITFAVFPRIWVPQSPFAGIQRPTKSALIYQTGFTDNVELGEIGEIMQSDARVLQFEITRMKDDSSISPGDFAAALQMDEILFRGNALGHYADGRWTSGSIQGRSVGDLESRRRFNSAMKESDFRVRIIQDPPIQTFAFAPTPVVNALNKDRNGRLEQRRFSYSLVHRIRSDNLRAEPSVYEIWCQAAPHGQTNHRPRQRNLPASGITEMIDLLRPRNRIEQIEHDYAHSWCITQRLSESLPQLTQMATDLCSENGSLVTPRERIRRIFHYLNTSGEFSYSLSANVTDKSLDPVEDFLINQKTGHCEYFASACTLMLQSVGVPARVVNGYRGSDLNTVSGRFEVKQKYAHTWLEAYIDRDWETFDPTPAAEREKLVNTSGQLDWFKDLRLAMNDNWFDMVQKMSLQRQEAILRPWLTSLKSAWETIKNQGLTAALKMFYEEVILQPKKWVSLQTGFVTFFLLLILGLTIRAKPLRRLMARLSKLMQWFARDIRQQRSVVRFYDNFRTLCARHGLQLSESQTARENAAMAATHFAEYLPLAEDQILPARIAAAFNSVRFGARELSPEVVEAIRNDVTRLSSLLTTARPAPASS